MQFCWNASSNLTVLFFDEAISVLSRLKLWDKDEQWIKERVGMFNDIRPYLCKDEAVRNFIELAEGEV